MASSPPQQIDGRDPQACLDHADGLRKQGGEHFARGEWAKARAAYVRMIPWVKQWSGGGEAEQWQEQLGAEDSDRARLTPDLRERALALQVVAHRNMATCFLREREWAKARESTTRALELRPKDDKSLLLRAEVALRLKDVDAAEADLQACADQASDKWSVLDARRKKALAAHGARERALFGGMFQRGL